MKEEKLTGRGKAKLVVRYLRPVAWLFALGLLMSLFSQVFNALIPQIVRVTVDSVHGTEKPQLPAALAGALPIETLRQLNPQYKLDIIPATTKPYTLVLPQRYVMQYIAHEPEIQAKDSMYLKEYINPANIDKKRQERSGSVYVVKKGDTLGAIARRYRVTTAQLMRWNNIKSAHKLRIGQRLRIEGR